MKCGWAGERNLIAKGLVLPKGGRVDPWGENANAQEITVNTGQGGGGVYAVNLRHRAEAPSVSQKPGVVNQIRVMRARPPVRIHRFALIYVHANGGSSVALHYWRRVSTCKYRSAYSLCRGGDFPLLHSKSRRPADPFCSGMYWNFIQSNLTV